jgi:hypothetical protein
MKMNFGKKRRFLLRTDPITITSFSFYTGFMDWEIFKLFGRPISENQILQFNFLF